MAKKLYIQSTNNSKEFSYENAQAIENCVCVCAQEKDLVVRSKP